MRQYWERYILLVGVAILLTIAVALFWLSGGGNLIQIYREYLSQDIPNKQLSFYDFTDRGPRDVLSGYYAGSDPNGFYMWTYSGLKRFVHKQQTSVYYYLDMCGTIRQMAEGIVVNKVDGKEIVQDEMSYSLETWTSRMKKGDYVRVKRVGEGDDSKIIDKVWANNVSRYPYGALTLAECDNR